MVAAGAVAAVVTRGGQFLSFSLGIVPIRCFVSHMRIRFVVVNLPVSRIAVIFAHFPPVSPPSLSRGGEKWRYYDFYESVGIIQPAGRHRYREFLGEPLLCSFFFVAVESLLPGSHSRLLKSSQSSRLLGQWNLVRERTTFVERSRTNDKQSGDVEERGSVQRSTVFEIGVREVFHGGRCRKVFVHDAVEPLG